MIPVNSSEERIWQIREKDPNPAPGIQGKTAFSESYGGLTLAYWENGRSLKLIWKIPVDIPHGWQGDEEENLDGV